MNTTLYRSTIHPPDTDDRTVIHLPAADELRSLSWADRLSLALAVRLVERTRRPKRERRSRALTTDRDVLLRDRQLSANEAQALLSYDLHRQLR